MLKEAGKRAVRSKRLEECGLEGCSPHNDIKSNTVIENGNTMLGVWWNNTNISGGQRMRDSLNLCWDSSAVNTQNLKEFMFMSEFRRVSIVFAQHDISGDVDEQIAFVHDREPWFIPQFRDEQFMINNIAAIQRLKITGKSLGMHLSFIVYFFIETFIFGVF